RRSTLPFAFIGRFHERVNFQSFFGADRWLAGFEELHDLDYERRVPVVTAAGHDRLAAVDRGAVAVRAIAEAAIRADAAILPAADDKFGAIGLHARDGLATRPHDGKQRLDAMNAVPEQIGMMRLERAWPAGLATQYLADALIVAHRENARAKPQR